MKLYRVVLLLMKINTFLMEGTTMLDISLAATPHNSFYSRWPGYHSVRGVIIIIRSKQGRYLHTSTTQRFLRSWIVQYSYIGAVNIINDNYITLVTVVVMSMYKCIFTQTHSSQLCLLSTFTCTLSTHTNKHSGWQICRYRVSQKKWYFVEKRP